MRLSEQRNTFRMTTSAIFFSACLLATGFSLNVPTLQRVPSSLIAASSAAPALLCNRCLWILQHESRLLQTPDKPLYSRLALSLIESAYTCNHMLQPSDRTVPSPTARDKLSPSAVPLCSLNKLFRYIWTYFT